MSIFIYKQLFVWFYLTCWVIFDICCGWFNGWFWLIVYVWWGLVGLFRFLGCVLGCWFDLWYFICLRGCLLRLLGVYVLRLVFLGVCCVVFVFVFWLVVFWWFDWFVVCFDVVCCNDVGVSSYFDVGCTVLAVDYLFVDCVVVLFACWLCWLVWVVLCWLFCLLLFRFADDLGILLYL